MKREIKFRGKRTHNSEWVYGDFIHGVGMHYGDSYILPNQQWLPTDCDPLNGYKVDPDSVGQYTGLKDKNGTEIYEGDVLGCPEDVDFLPETVIFKEGCFMAKDDYTTTPINAIDTEYRTIIGNIHDNPELLKL